MSRIKITQHTDPNGKTNQDSSAVIRQGERAILCIADGIGGLDIGEIASKYITSYIEIWSKEKDSNRMGVKATIREFGDLMTRLHEDLLSIGEDRGKRLGSTLIIAVVGIGKIVIGAIGDSRVYIRQGNTCSLITKDQTVEEYEKKTGESLVSVEKEAKKRTLTEWLGHGKDAPQPIYYETDIDENVDILLCTDGLSNLLSEEEILHELKKGQGGEKVLINLTEQAKNKGETDNITAVLYRRRKDQRKKTSTGTDKM